MAYCNNNNNNTTINIVNNNNKNNKKTLNNDHDGGLGLGYNTQKPVSSSSAIFNRSFTMHSSATQNDFTKKPLGYTFERKGSMKKLYNSSYDSVVSAGNSLKGKVKQLCSIFERPPQSSTNLQPLPSPTEEKKLSVTDSAPARTGVSAFPPGTEDRVVIYFTSLRGVRKTFQDCSYVRMIFKGFRIKLDERDISMHSEYRKEISGFLLGQGEKTVTLPQVFIRGKHIGGVDVVRQLHETGELAKMLKGIPINPVFKACDECGDIRFVPCSNCNGSKKVFDEVEEQVRRCPECNENGLIHCPLCSVS